MGSLCYNTIMSSSCIIFIVIFLKSVNSKVHVVSSQNKLAVKVGHDIFAKMGKDGIELEKIEDYSDKTFKEMLKVKNMKIFLIIHNIILFCKDPVENDKLVDKYDTRAVGISGFLTRSLTGEAFYFTLFWIVFGILIGQLAKDISTYLKPSSSSSNHSVCPATDILDLPPPYKIIEEKGEAV